MKKSLKLIMGIVLIAGLFLSACSSKSSSTNNESANKDGVVTLQFMGWEASPLETKSVKAGLKKFESEHPNIKVNYTPVPNDQYHSKLLTMMTGGAGPDVFFLGADQYRGFQKRGVLMDLTPLFDQGDFQLDDFIPSSQKIMQIDGNIYGISSCTVSPVLFYNKDIFDKAGIDYPPSDPDQAWDWNKFVEVANKLTIKKDGKTDQYGVYGLDNFYMSVALVLANGGNVLAADGKSIALNSPKVQEVLEAVKQLDQTGVSPAAKTLENIGMNGSQMLQTGKIGMLIDGSWSLQELAQMDFPVGIAPLPKFHGVTTTHGQAHVHAVNKNTKHPKEALELEKFLSSEWYQTQNIKEGLWLPNRKSMYSEEGIKKWLNPDVYPDGFDKLVPFVRDAEAYPFVMTDKLKVNDIVTEELDKYFYGNQSVEDTLKNIESRGNSELAR